MGRASAHPHRARKVGVCGHHHDSGVKARLIFGLTRADFGLGSPVAKVGHAQLEIGVYLTKCRVCWMGWCRGKRWPTRSDRGDPTYVFLEGRQYEQRVDASALRADEGRGIAAISVGEPRAGIDPTISEWGNPIVVTR